MSDFLALAERRRSIRRYSERPVSDELVKRLLDAMRRAPSSMGTQPWEIVVVRDPAVRERLAAHKERWCPPEKAEYRAGWLRDAPVVLAICVREAESHGRWIENGVIAATYLLLAATEAGLGTTFLTAYNLDTPQQQEEVREILGAPAPIAPVCFVPLGYPAEEPSPRTLRNLQSMLHHDRF